MEGRKTAAQASRAVSERANPGEQRRSADTRSASTAKPSDIVKSPLAYGRETVESIVVAFTLALLFRAFEAEAFVIPTGSMAPTLMGRHKDIACESCGRPHQLSASSEEHGRKVRQARCPNCGWVTPLLMPGREPAVYDPRYPSFNGDRILVSKFAYDFGEPERWDVVVFKYPEDAKTNYIKRLVGLPGETVFIRDGDIWIGRGDSPPRIARKPPEKLLAMLQCVYDSRYESARLRQAGWPACFDDWLPAEGGSWKTSDDGRSFETSVEGDGRAMLRYRHFFPDPSVWESLARGERVGGAAEAKLIDDFQPYNPEPTSPHWVGDLAIEFDFESRSPSGELVVDLVEAGVRREVRIDLATGDAMLLLAGGDGSGSGEPAPPRGRTQVSGRGRWRIHAANVDDEMSLFVDGRPVVFDRPTTYEAGAAGRPDGSGREPGSTKPGDLSPIGISLRGAAAKIERLRVLRDVYYVRAADIHPMMARAADSPGYPLAADQFFMLGDNSSASMDSRLWKRSHHVDRDLLIGKALAIFWPHGIPARWSVSVPVGSSEVRLPFWPNFARMRFIR